MNECRHLCYPPLKPLAALHAHTHAHTTARHAQGLMLCCTWQFFCATVILGYKPDSAAIPSWFLSSA